MLDLSQPCFQRELELPETDAHPKLTVSYAVTGARESAKGTVLFIGGMASCRYLAAVGSNGAQKAGVRLVVVDRPGMGKSTNVETCQRIPVWLETVPLLMKELTADHVSIIAHSCGVIYALNTISKMPNILPPSNPVVYLFAPWVPPEHSARKWLSKLPSPLINRLDSAIRSRFLSRLLTWLSVFPSGSDTEIPKHEQDEPCEELLGVSAGDAAKLLNAIRSRIEEEGTRGINNEALLALRKRKAGTWGDCHSYETYPAVIKERRSKHFQGNAPPPLIIKAYWAQDDNMVGERGKQYFDKCFQHSDGNLLYVSETVPGTDHETVCYPQNGILSRVCDEIVK